MPAGSPHERAERLWERGDIESSLLLLKRRVRETPSDDVARRTLVDHYRELGAPDQAGRWALAIPGLATPLEKDRAARMLAASRVEDDRLVEFLALPRGVISEDVDALMPSVARYAARRAHTPSPGPMPALSGWPESAAWVLLCISVIVVILAPAIVWTVAAAGLPATQTARWAAAITSVCFGATALGFGAPRIKGTPIAALGLIGGGLLACAVGLTMMGAAVVHGGNILFPWER